MVQQVEQWVGTVRLDVQELPEGRQRVYAVMPDLLGIGPIDVGPATLDAQEAAQFNKLFEHAMAIVRIAAQRECLANDQDEGRERPTVLSTDLRALPPRER